MINHIAQTELEIIVLTGYTDTSGAAQYDMKLSLRRAQSVKDYLVSKSIPADRIDVEGKGQADPLATNKTRQGRAQKRRFESIAIINQFHSSSNKMPQPD